MAVRLQYDSTGAMTCVADTPAEAADFALAYDAKKASVRPEQLSLAHPVKAEPKAARRTRRSVFRVSTVAQGTWDVATVSRYLEPLTGYSFAFIAVLVDRQFVPSADMGLSIGAPQNVVGPIVRTLITQAERLGMPAPFSTQMYVGSGKTYTMSKSFRDLATGLVAAKRAA